MQIVLNILVGGAEDSTKARETASILGIKITQPQPRMPRGGQSNRPYSPLFLTLDEKEGLAFVRELAQRGIQPVIGYDVRHTRKELLQSALLLVQPATTRANAEVDDEARYRGAKGGCQKCGSLAELRGPLILRGEPEPESNCVVTSTDEWLVSPALAHHLRGVDDVASRLASVARPGAWRGWEQLIVTSNLPPIHPGSTGFVLEEQCSVCRRDGFGIDARTEPFVLGYGRSDLRDLNPVNGTYELVGNSWRDGRQVGSVAMPMLIVRPDVARILLDETTGDVRLDPVELV